MSFTFDHIRDSGFEASLDQLIAYAEMQARLYQSLNDRDRMTWIFWVRAWASLQRVSDAIAFPTDEKECLDMWSEHCSEYVSADIDFGFQQ